MHAPANRTTIGQHAGHIRNAAEKTCTSSNIGSRCGDFDAVTHEGVGSMNPHSTMLLMGGTNELVECHARTSTAKVKQRLHECPSAGFMMWCTV